MREESLAISNANIANYKFKGQYGTIGDVVGDRLGRL